MPKKEAYTLNSIYIKPYWNPRSGADASKLTGKIAFNDETGTKAFEVSLDNDLAKEITEFVVKRLTENRSGTIINAIKDKLTI